MVVYPCDVHKVPRLLTGKKGQLRKEVPSVAMMTNFGFGPNAKSYNAVCDVVPVNFKYKVLLNLRKQYVIS